MPARRGRPLTFDRDQALDRLMHLFWRQGYEATSQADMIASADISASSLHNSFGNKSDVYDAVLKRYNDNAADHFGLLRDTGRLDDVLAFLEGIAGHIRAPQSPAGCLMVRTMTELDGRPGAPPLTGQTEVSRAQIRESMRAALGRAVEHGEIAGGGLDQKVDVILSFYLGSLAAGMDAPRAGARIMEAGIDLVRSWRLDSSS